MDDKLVFNVEHFRNLTCNDNELALQVTDVFLTDVPEQLDNLESALIKSDAKAAERISHSLKGASAAVGGERMREIAFVCEALGREGKLEDLAVRVVDLRQCFTELRGALLATGFGTMDGKR